MSRKYCLTLNLKNNPALIRQYEEHHKAVWPEIIQSIKEAGIENMEIYRFDTRLFMIMEVNDFFSFEKKQQADRDNEKVQAWEALMWNYQEAVPGALKNEKWVLMNKIFELYEVSTHREEQHYQINPPSFPAQTFHQMTIDLK